MRPVSTKEIIACRCARELKSGEVVNLGIGIPTLTANCLPQHLDVTFHTRTAHSASARARARSILTAISPMPDASQLRSSPGPQSWI